MKSDRIEALLHRYYEGDTTLAEEKELQDFFNETSPLPDHLKPHAASFQYYAGKQQEQLPEELSDDWLFEKIEEEQPAGKQVFFPAMREIATYWRVAASVLLVLGAFWVGKEYNSKQGASSDKAELAALQAEVRALKTAMETGASASERIQLVSQDFQQEQPDELIEVLVTTMNQDPNVNVRVAASEALYRFHDRPEVRDALIASMKLQTDPLMQLTLIDMLVSIKEKEAIGELEEFSQRKDLLPIVKDKAAEGLGKLI